MRTQTPACYNVLFGSCTPIVYTVPSSVVFIHDLFDLPGVISRILVQKISRQLVEGCHCNLASTQVLEECLYNNKNNHIGIIVTLKMGQMLALVS